MDIIFAGDFCPYGRLSNIDFDNTCIISEQVCEIIQKANLSFVNFECPIVDSQLQPIDKQGPCLCSPPKAMGYIKKVGFTGITIANNHIRDYGGRGVLNVIDAANDIGLVYVGAGAKEDPQKDILYYQHNDYTIAIINCCENEFSTINDTASASAINPIRHYYLIKEAKRKCDMVFVVVHGGIEHYQYPTNRMVQTYRFFIDAGADAVINHHQHCPCGYEEYKGKPIFYGIGNFCFDWDGKRNSIWNIGYLVRIKVDNNDIQYDVIPYRQCDRTPTVDLLGGESLNSFDIMIQSLCISFDDTHLLNDLLKDYNSKNDFLYRKMLEPYTGKITTGLFRRGLLPSTLNKARILAMKDFMSCESHYERLNELLERLYKQYTDE